ncbi:MAG: DUF853 domain-containing protein [Bacteroidia bacterium]|nr:DUF853 domain-containing protein [Bacteroidia bacterium]
MEKKLLYHKNRFEFIGKAITLGAAKVGNNIIADFPVSIPLLMMNRHGVIAGATGTGKTKTLQLLAEELSLAGVSCLMMDIKGDLSGIGRPGEKKDFISKRHEALKMEWNAVQLPVTYYSLSGKEGIPMRATLSEFGPLLLSRILGLTDIQEGVLQVIFKYADDKNLPILDIKDLQELCKHIQEPEVNKEIKNQYGLITSSSISAILRALLELEQQGGNVLFGEPSFDVQDLVQVNSEGKGMCSVIRLSDMQNKPKLFSTFMLCLMAEIYQTFPERGDADKPLLCIFIDEAHLIFENASKVLMEQLQMMARLIRSKGIGLYFITQNPTDIPDEILGQLGLKIQHALRAFTEKDRKAIKAMADNFPPSDIYNISELLTSVGIGEAIVCGLDEKGMPLPPIHTVMKAPKTRMDVISPAELQEALNSSNLSKKYGQLVDRESAYEILQNKLKKENEEDEKEEVKEEAPKKTAKSGPGTFEKILKSSVTTTIVREVTRGLLGVLGLGGTSRRRRRF